MKIERIYPRDIVGIIAITFCMILIGKGINHLVSGIAIMIITYYFSKRIYEERNGWDTKPTEPKKEVKSEEKTEPLPIKTKIEEIKPIKRLEQGNYTNLAKPV